MVEVKIHPAMREVEDEYCRACHAGDWARAQALVEAAGLTWYSDEELLEGYLQRKKCKTGPPR